MGTEHELRAIVEPLLELTADSYASVLMFVIAGCPDRDDHCVVVNCEQPPLPEEYYGVSFAAALAKAVCEKRKESDS